MHTLKADDLLIYNSSWPDVENCLLFIIALGEWNKYRGLITGERAKMVEHAMIKIKELKGSSITYCHFALLDCRSGYINTFRWKRKLLLHWLLRPESRGTEEWRLKRENLLHFFPFFSCVGEPISSLEVK